MSGLENLNKRLNYRGGNQEGRMQQRKLETLKKALIYSYQAATAKLSDGREFRCLINPDKLKENYDDKIISIPFKDICLNAERVGKTSEGQVEIGMKAGDVFEWKETGTHWLVYLQRLEEDAYFRAEIRRCQYEVQVGEDTYKVYVRGPGGADISWHTKQTGISWNDLNYDAVMYITRDEKTMEAFKRFDIIEIAGKPWEVQMVDRLTTEGIITINLKEYTSSTKEILEASIELYERIINKDLLVRRITIVANNVKSESEILKEKQNEQINLFNNLDDELKKEEHRLKENKLQHAIIDIKKKYGKNSILKAMNFEESGTTIQRNSQIGGHSE